MGIGNGSSFKSPDLAKCKTSRAESFPGDSSVFPVVSQSQGSRSGGESSPCIAALPASGPHLPAQLVPDLSLSNPATPASPSPNTALQDRPCFQILLPEGLSQFTPRHTREAQTTRPSLGKPAPSLPGRGSRPPLGPSGPLPVPSVTAFFPQSQAGDSLIQGTPRARQQGRERVGGERRGPGILP